MNTGRLADTLDTILGGPSPFSLLVTPREGEKGESGAKIVSNVSGRQPVRE
jgi:hypothetical protein